MKTKDEKKKYDADRQREYRKKNADKVRAAERKYYRANPEKYNERRKRYSEKGKNQYYVRNYGISLEDYNLLLGKQNSKCAVCGSIDPRGFGGKSFHVDHDHETGEVRGLLCQPCNMALGLIKDDITTLSSAIMYLESFNKKRN